MDVSGKINLINQNLGKYFISEHPAVIYEAASYSLFAGGKRLRPLLLLFTNEALRGEAKRALPFACAVEMIHTYSLIHDDLPCMDDDDFRRGKPTNHKVYGEALALLAGDALLNKAYEVMAEACAADCAKPLIDALKEIAAAAGMKGMIGGQVADMLAENTKSDSEALLYIQRNKTAALIKASVKAGALLAGVPSEAPSCSAQAKVINELSIFAEAFGIAFQIQDDILDISAETETLGKPAGSDAKNAKLTYVSCFGLVKAKEDCKKLFEQAFAALDRAGFKESGLKNYVETLIERRF